MANIFWSYNSEQGNFSPLPASPLLLPAIGVLGALAVFNACQSREYILDESPQIESDELTRNTEVYNRLRNKGMENFTDSDWIEWNRISYPSWHNNRNGPPWGY